MTDSPYRVFLSAVTSEFGKARDEIANDLQARGYEVKVQRSLRQEPTAETTLQKFDLYLSGCSAVVHVAGKRSGGFPSGEEATPFLHVLPAGVTRASYTQFEYYLARRRGCTIYVYVAGDDYPPDAPRPTAEDDDSVSQAEHLARLKQRDRDLFSSVDELRRLVLKQDWPTRTVHRPNTLLFSPLGDRFKGRERALDELGAALRGEGHAAAVVGRAVHGLGGVGKTRLAIEYAWRHADDYSALLFLAADTPAKLDASLAALAAALDLPEMEAARDDIKIPAVLKGLAARPTWLMILDNVDDANAVAAVARLLPRLRGGHVIVTARATEFPPALRKLELGVLELPAATQFLLARTQDERAAAPDDPARAGELARELDGLALALEQAGAYIARQRIGFARYLALWRDKRERVLAWFDPTTMSYNHDVGLAATWATSVEKLSPRSRRLLDRLAFLAPDPIPDSLLDVAVPGEAEDYDAHEARAGLFALSLISAAKGEDGVAKGFAMHRLVQDFARRSMTEARRGEALREALAWVDAALSGDPWDVRAWPVLDPLASHISLVATRADAAGIAAPTGRLFVYRGGLFQGKARYAEAEPLFRRALAIDEASVGPDHPEVATNLNNLARLLQATNRLAEAEPLFRRALAIGEANLGPDHPKVAIRLNNLALLLKDTNRLAEAEPLYRRALAIDEASLGPDHRDVASYLNNLAVLLRATNRLAEAEPLFRRGLAIDEASLGPDHPNVATRLNNLAGLLKATNRLAEAEPLYRRALAIDEANLGPDHPSVATRLNNLAGLLKATNRLAEAEPLYRRALAIDEANLGPDHPNVATNLNNLALLLQDTNRLAESEPLFRRALAIDEASLGPDHPNVARELNNLADLLQATNRHSEAEPLFRRALAIDEASLGPDHPDVAIDLNNLAGLLQATNRLAEAEPLFRRALAIFEASLGRTIRAPRQSVEISPIWFRFGKPKRSWSRRARPAPRRPLAPASLTPPYPTTPASSDSHTSIQCLSGSWK